MPRSRATARSWTPVGAVGDQVLAGHGLDLGDGLGADALAAGRRRRDAARPARRSW